MVKGLSAGPEIVCSTKAIPCAVSFTSPVTALGGGPPDGAGPPDGGAEPDGAGRAGRGWHPAARRARWQEPGLEQDPGHEDDAEDAQHQRWGPRRWLGVEVPGPIGLDRGAVLLDGVDQPADERHDQGHDRRPAGASRRTPGRPSASTRRGPRGSAGTRVRACGRRAAGRRGSRPAAPARSSPTRGRRSACPRPASRGGSTRGPGRPATASAPP